MPDGEIKFTEVRGRFICDEEGVPYEVRGITKDITEEVNANILNEVQRDRLTAAAEIARLGYWEFDFSSGQVYWSKELFGLLQVDPEKEPANFDRYVALIHPEDRELSLKLFSDSVKQGSFKREHRMLLDSGDIIYLEESASFEVDKDGNPIIARGVSHDITEAKLRAIELEKETEDHNKAQEIAKIGHWKFDIINGTVDWSNNVYKLWDKDPKTFKPSFESVLATVYHEDAEKVQNEINRSIQNKSRGHVEHRVAYPDGTIRYFEEQWDVELDSEGEVAFFVGMVLDRTEAIKQKHELEEVQQMHSKAQSIAHIGHFRWDIERDVLEWSDEMYKIWGITKPDRELKFADCTSAYHPGELPIKLKAIDESMASGEDGSMIHKVIRPDGSERTVEARWQIEFSQKDNRKYLIGTVHDITDAFKQKREIEEIQLLYQKAQSIASVGHFKFQIATQAVEWSDEVYKIWGLEKEGDLTFEKVAKGYHPDEIEAVNKAIEESIRTHEEGYIQHKVIRPNGDVRVVEAKWEIQLNSENEPIEFIGTVHDITESWEVNHKLIEAEKIALLGHWTLDHITGELFWSDQVFKIFDLSPKEFPANYEAFLSYIHPEDRAMVDEAYSTAIETKNVYEVDHRLLVDGKVKYVTEKAITHYDEQGKPIKSIGTVQDITEKKLVQEKADEASKRLGMLVESIPDLIFVYDKEGYYIDYFESAFDQPLVPPEVFMGKHYSQVLPKTVAQRVDKFLPLALETGEVQKFPFQLDKEGVEKWYEATMAPYRDGDEVIGVTIVNRDVTKEKVYENQLVDTKLNLELILNSLDKLLCIIDDEGRYVDIFFSDNGIKPIIPKEEIIGKRWEEVMPPDVHDKIAYAFKLVDKKKISTEVSYSLEINGMRQFFEASVSPFIDERKGIQGYSVLVSDITDRKRAKKLLKKSEERFKKHSEFLPHMLWTRNLKGELTYMNAKGQEYYGKYLKKINKLSNDPLYVIHPQDRANSQKLWNRANRNKTSFQNLERRKDDKGVYRWFNIKVDPIFDKDGKFMSWIGVATDVDKEQKVARENEDLVNNLQERVKEAECMYAISHLAEKLSLSLDHIFEEAAEIIPTGFQFPELTQAQILYNNKRFGGQIRYRNKRVHDLKVRDQKVGEVIVGVSAKSPNGQLNFFLKEEERLLGAITDNLSLILTQKLDQLVLAESEKRFKSLFNSASIGIIIQDLPTLQIVDVNQAMSGLLHYDRTDLLGLTLLDLSPAYQGDDISSVEKFDEVNGTNTGGYFWKLLDNYGQNIHCAINVNTIDIEGKQYQVSFIRNVSDEMAAYTALENSEELYRNIFENIQEGYYLRDLDGKIININPEGLRILEAEEKEVVDHSAAKFFMHDDRRELTFLDDDNTQVVQDLQVRAITPQGKEKYISLNKKLITSNDAPWVVECSFRDITQSVLYTKLQTLTLGLVNEESISSEEILKKAVDQVCEVFGARYAFFHFVDLKEKEVKYSTFSKDSGVKSIPHAVSFNKIGFWEGVLTTRTGNTFSKKEILLAKRRKTDGKVENAMVTPIIIKGEIVAVLGICNRGYDFSNMELSLLNDFGLQFYSLYDQAKTQDAYLTSLDNLERSQEAGKIGAWTYDVVFDETWWSDIMFDLYGIDKLEGIPSDNWVDFTHPDDRDMHIKAFEDAFASGNFECEYRLVTPKGEIRHLKAMADIKRDKNGVPLKFNGFVQDVTAIKKAEEAIIEEKQKFENIVDALPGIVYRLSLPDVSLEYVSDHTQDLLGIPPYLFANAKGEDFILSLVHPDDWEGVRKTITRAVEDVDTYSLIHRMKKDDGKYVWVSNTGKISLAGDDTYDVEGFIYDVTDRIKNEERIMNAVMEASDKEKSRISKEIHDSLQQTLTIASLNLEFVRKEKENLSNKARDKFKTGWTYLKKSMDDSRSIAHRLMPKAITDFGVVPVLKDMLEELNRSGDVEFEFITNFEDRIKIPAATNVYKVVQEAVNNILKHADAKTVTVQYLLLDGLIQLSIEDDGCGFDITQVGKKSSFGLASMKSRATALSAELLIDSHPGHGTTLVLEIPYNENVKYYE